MNQPNIGAVIGGFRLDEVAGVGGMGAVFRAYDMTLQRVVAVKVITPHLARDAEFRERFRREGRLAASLDHPHVVPVLGAGEDRGFLYLTMRFIEGTDLAKIIREHAPLDPTFAVPLIAQVAAALDAAHARGLVHRDVKPANVLVTRHEGSSHSYLTDFGITKEVTAPGMTQTGLVVGTVDYMAPEQALADVSDGRADQYALACVLFHALTGRVPFVGGNQVARLSAHVRAPIPDVREAVPHLDPALANVMRRGMAKRPEDRFATCREFAEAASAAIGRPEHRSAAAGSQDGSSRRMILGAGTVAVAAVVGGGAWYALARSAPVAGPTTPTGPVVAEIVRPAIAVPGETRHVDGDDRVMWVANGEAASVSRIDVASRKVTGTLAVPGVPTWLAVGKERIYVWSYSSAFAMFDANAGPQSGITLLRVDEEMRRFSASDPHLWFTVPGKNAVGLIDMPSGTIKHRLIDIGGRPLNLQASEGTLHVVSEKGPSLISVNVEDGRITSEMPIPKGMHSVGVVPGDGRYVVGRTAIAKISGSEVPKSALVPLVRNSIVEPVKGGMWVLDAVEGTFSNVGPDLKTDVGKPLTGIPTPLASMMRVGTTFWVLQDPSGLLEVRPTAQNGA